MAQPLRTEDFPDFDTYPGREEREAGGPLESAAEQIGSTVGRAIRAARELPERMEQARDELRDRMTVIRARGGPSVADKAAELKDAARQKLDEGRQRAADLARQARARATRLADERPLHVLAGIFAAGIVAGLALRLWRNHD